MLIGVPKEIKDNENRVSTTPGGVSEYVHHGHTVLVERSAGAGSGFADEEYANAGAELVGQHADVFARADMIIKVKEPLPSEYPLLRRNQILYTYLHLAAEPELTRALVEQQVTAIAYETVQLPDRSLPLLAPMSEVAGRMSIQVGAHYLQKPEGGRGMLLGGVAGVPPARVVIVGGGIVGTNAAEMALGLQAETTVIDINVDRLRYLEHVLHGRFTTLTSSRHNIAEAVKGADLVVGAVLIPGAKAPKLVTREMVATMRPGSVIVDVAIDQGGSVETIHPTAHSNPVYTESGVIHYGVTNMPGAVPRTSTFALSNVTLPYGLKLADLGFAAAVERDPALAKGVNVYHGHVTYQSVAEALGLPYTPLADVV
ncbi:MAG TPA: alanine dehydrogenase [Thermomicrobiaceae bacterium]|nr:alanine dehydrogenase [Thermomicrobiaceae bacterium]